MPYSYQVTRIEKLMIMKLVTIYILIFMLLLSCTSKKDSNTQATIDSLSIYDNHPILEISEAKHLSKKILQTIVILLKAILRVVDVFTVKLFVKKLMSVILL